MRFIERNPTALIPIFVIVVVAGLAFWSLRSDLKSLGLSVVPTSRLDAIERKNQELSNRVDRLEKRLQLVIWLSRECPEIRRTMDEHGVYKSDKGD